MIMVAVAKHGKSRSHSRANVTKFVEKYMLMIGRYAIQSILECLSDSLVVVAYQMNNQKVPSAVAHLIGWYGWFRSSAYDGRPTSKRDNVVWSVKP